MIEWYDSKSFVLQIVAWNYNIIRIIITNLKPYNNVQKPNYYKIEIITWIHIQLYANYFI